MCSLRPLFIDTSFLFAQLDIWCLLYVFIYTMPPQRTIPPAKAIKTERTHEENQERSVYATWPDRFHVAANVLAVLISLLLDEVTEVLRLELNPLDGHLRSTSGVPAVLFA